MITCPNCGAANRDQSSVCRMCATPLKTTAARTSPEITEQEATNIVQDIACPRCQATNEAGWSFCQNCGGRLPQVSQAPAEPADEPARPAPVEREAYREPHGVRTVPNEVPADRAAPADDMLDAAPPTVVAPAVPPQPVRPSKPSSPDLRTVPDQRWVHQPPPQQPPAPKPPPSQTEMVSSGSLPARKGDGPACPACGHTNPPGINTCESCGATMTVAQTMVMSSPFAQGRGRLHLIMEGGQSGEVYDIGDEAIIGRANGQITFPHDGFMSGRHARIMRRGTSYVLTDEGSRNGTFVRIKGEVELKPGDIILIGKQLFRFEE